MAFNWDRMLTGNKVRRTIENTLDALSIDVDMDSFVKEFTRLYEIDTTRPRKDKEITEKQVDAVRTYLDTGDSAPLRSLYKSAESREKLVDAVRESGLLDAE